MCLDDVWKPTFREFDRRTVESFRRKQPMSGLDTLFQRLLMAPSFNDINAV